MRKGVIDWVEENPKIWYKIYDRSPSKSNNLLPWVEHCMISALHESHISKLFFRGYIFESGVIKFGIIYFTKIINSIVYIVFESF